MIVFAGPLVKSWQGTRTEFSVVHLQLKAELSYTKLQEWMYRFNTPANNKIDKRSKISSFYIKKSIGSLKESRFGRWGDGSVIKSTYCSCMLKMSTSILSGTWLPKTRKSRSVRREVFPLLIPVLMCTYPHL